MRLTPDRIVSMLRGVSAPLASGLAYYVAARFSILLSAGDPTFVTLWPPSGVLLAAVLISSRHLVALHVMSAAVASFFINMQAGHPLPLSIAYTTVNVIEPLAASWLLGLRRYSKLSFLDPSILLDFCLAALLSSTLCATMASVITPGSSMTLWVSWILVDLLGMLIVTPLLLLVAKNVASLRSRITAEMLDRKIASFIGVALVSALSFSQTSYPTLFVPMLAVIAATFQTGALGAASSVLIIIVIASLANSIGTGPFMLVSEGGTKRIIFMQFYFLTLFTSSLPFAALLSARSSLLDKLKESLRLLEMAERSSHVGHWHLDLNTERLSWSNEVFRIHGLEASTPLTLDMAINAYHSDDRALVSHSINQALKRSREFSFTARLVRPSGEIRHVFSRGEVVGESQSDSVALFGIIQDITAQVGREAELKRALHRAEQIADRAKVLSETDQLTGIANRRRTVEVLEQNIRSSDITKEPVSIAIFDIDHFKTINDTYGHQAGDEVLKRVAREASSELRSTDLLGRIGGEEFVVILPRTDATTAMTIADRVRLAIEATDSNPSVTISAGVAQVVRGETYESLLRRADVALYDAKRDGRNLLRLAG